MSKSKEPFAPQRDARGKRTRNPGYESGNHWVECDRCGCDIREKDAKETWDGLVVCPDDFETRHPQDFVRGRREEIAAKGLVRSQTTDEFIDNPAKLPPSSTIPDPTF